MSAGAAWIVWATLLAGCIASGFGKWTLAAACAFEAAAVAVGAVWLA